MWTVVVLIGGSWIVWGKNYDEQRALNALTLLGDLGRAYKV